MLKMSLFSHLRRGMNRSNKDGIASHDPAPHSFETLLPETPELRSRLVEFVGMVNRSGGSYHRLDFGHGIVMDGEYDMTKYIDHYGIPRDLTGGHVLDIGTASGFFALECARRGAQVTAIDIWDASYYNEFFAALGVACQYFQKSIYDLDSTLGQFDLVICGSLLLHLRDIFHAVEKIQSVCKREAIVATASVEDEQCNQQAYCEFVGTKNTSSAGEYWVYWHVSPTALKKMLLAAGFSRVDEIGKFVLQSEPGKNGFAVPHVVAKSVI
jgi:2-polyprenyl-3-methyl-5-hydroxy-6-metoxy-1,4-benzoquinol methylase